MDFLPGAQTEQGINGCLLQTQLHRPASSNPLDGKAKRTATHVQQQRIERTLRSTLNFVLTGHSRSLAFNIHLGRESRDRCLPFVVLYAGFASRGDKLFAPDPFPIQSSDTERKDVSRTFVRGIRQAPICARVRVSVCVWEKEG